jgi:hypothetical protein
MEVETLGQETDKKGSLLTIKRSKSLAYSPAYTFYVRQVVELIENKHTFDSNTWDDDECGIIWAEDQDKICGIFCYNKAWIKTLKMLTIQLTAVGTDYRQRGIHSILNKYFEQTARELNCCITVATVSPKNTVRLATCEKDGLIPKNLLMYKKI